MIAFVQIGTINDVHGEPEYVGITLDGATAALVCRRLLEEALDSLNDPENDALEENKARAAVERLKGLVTLAERQAAGQARQEAEHRAWLAEHPEEART